MDAHDSFASEYTNEIDGNVTQDRTYIYSSRGSNKTYFK